MASSVIVSPTSPTGYVNSSGAIVNQDGSAYTGAGVVSGSYNPIGTSSSSSINSGLTTLSPSKTTGKSVSLSGTPDITETANQVSPDQYNLQQPLQSVQEQPPTVSLAAGGLGAPVQTSAPAPVSYRPNISHGQAVGLTGLPGHDRVGDMGGHLLGAPGNLIGRAAGGHIPEGHNPEFFSEGGASIAHRYVQGDGDGTSDSVPAMLAAGEFVIPADVVSSLGNGDNNAGSKTLDAFLAVIRKHKRAADAKKLPPDSKGPLAYLTDAKRKVKS